MPTILTRSAGSARGYGLTGNPTIYRVQQTLQSTTWTAPAGVTSLLSVTGKGQDGYAAYWRNIYLLDLQPPGYILPYWLADVPDPNNTDSSVVEAFAQSQYDLFPSNPGDGTFTMSWECRRYVDTSTYISSSYGPYDIRCSGTKAKTGNGWGSTYPPDPGFRPIYQITGNLEYYIPQFNGANTTGFGYTFAGGVGAAATPVTYNNVPVTPGTTYTINSTGDGYITIIYYLQV